LKHKLNEKHGQTDENNHRLNIEGPIEDPGQKVDCIDLRIAGQVVRISEEDREDRSCSDNR
jgi:hypothetical protein